MINNATNFPRLIKANLRRATRVAIVLLTSVWMQKGFACPSDQYEVCFISCICIPNSGIAEKPLREPSVFFAAPALQKWIETSRHEAMKGDVRPVPTSIRTHLARFFDASLLDSVRYKVGDTGVLNTARLAFNNHEVQAVTLIDLVVFRSAQDAKSNIPLWAHELWHVQQFRDWGVKDFAVNYARDFNAVEDAAKAKERQVADSLRVQGTPGCSDATQVATALYRRVLDREPDAAGLQHNASLLYNNKINVRNLTLGMLLSEEHVSRFARGKPAAEQVTYLYRHALAREPDSVGETHNARRLAEIGYNELAKGFVGSVEYSTRFNDWVVPGGPLQVIKYCP